MANESDTVQVVQELWERYHELSTRRGLGKCEHLIRRLLEALPGYEVPSYQAANIVKALIDKAIDKAESDAKGCRKGDPKERYLLKAERQHANYCKVAFVLMGLTEHPAEKLGVRESNAADVASISVSTIRRWAKERTCFAALLSAIDEVLNNPSSDNERNHLAQTLSLRRINSPGAGSSLLVARAEGSVATHSNNDHRPVSPNDLLDISALLRRRLDPQKVTKALRRTNVVEKIVTSLQITTETCTSPKIIVIRGKAGAGKTVISGQLYDALVDRDQAAVLVIPCEMLLAVPKTAEEFDNKFGHLIGTDSGLVAAVRVLTGAQSRPVVILLDTLDYLLNETTRVGLVELLGLVHDVGATVIFSCRRHDYDVWLGYNNVGLGRLALYAAQPVDVPQLRDNEVVEITKSYLEHHDIRPPMGIDQFASEVLQLAADRVPLKDIVTNPLLLIMLCDTFAETGIVPRDLTTTRLCATYREEKINKSRKHPANTAIAHVKLRIWQRVAGEMWSLSDEHLALSVPEIGLVEDKQSREAYHDLRSEEVLVTGLDSLRVKFNHQVLAEYSIAMYLRDAAPAELDALLDRLRLNPTMRWYGWQIVRHLIAATDNTVEVERLLNKLDLSQAPAFRAAIFGLAEQWHKSLIEPLSHSDVFVDDILEALQLVPDGALGEAFDIVGNIMMRGTSAQISMAAATAGILAVREPDILQSEVVKLLEILYGIRTGTIPIPKADPNYPDTLLASIISPMIDRQVSLNNSVLAATRALVPYATPGGVRLIIRAHLQPKVSIDDQNRLLQKVLTHEQAYNIGEEAADLIAAAIDWSVDSERTGKYVKHPVEFLSAGGKNSHRLRAMAVARAVNAHIELREAIVSIFLETADKKTGECVLICMQEALKHGGGEWISATLTTHTMPGNSASIGRVGALLKTGVHLSGTIRYKLADWFATAVTPESYGSVDAYLRLVYDNARRRKRAISHLASLPDEQQESVLANLARELKPEQWRSVNGILNQLEATGKESTTLLRARLAGKTAILGEEIQQVLLDLVNHPSALTSLQALRGLQIAAEAKEHWLIPDLLVRFAESSRRHVRLGALKALVSLVRNGNGDPDGAVTTWLTAATERGITINDASLEEMCVLVELSHAYLRNGAGVAPVALTAIRQFINIVIEAMTAEVPFARAHLSLIKTAVRHPNVVFSNCASGWCLDSLDKIDLAKVNDGQAFAQETLGVAVERDYLRLTTLLGRARKWPAVNLIVAVNVIVSHDPVREKSPLLDQILAWEVDIKVCRAIWKRRESRE